MIPRQPQDAPVLAVRLRLLLLRLRLTRRDIGVGVQTEVDHERAAAQYDQTQHDHDGDEPTGPGPFRGGQVRRHRRVRGHRRPDGQSPRYGGDAVRVAVLMGYARYLPRGGTGGEGQWTGRGPHCEHPFQHPLDTAVTGLTQCDHIGLFIIEVGLEDRRVGGSARGVRPSDGVRQECSTRWVLRRGDTQCEDLDLAAFVVGAFIDFVGAIDSRSGHVGVRP